MPGPARKPLYTRLYTHAEASPLYTVLVIWPTTTRGPRLRDPLADAHPILTCLIPCSST